MSQLTQPDEHRKERILTPGFMRLLALQVAFGTSYSSFLLLPKFLRTELSASAAEIGFMAGVAVVGAAVVSPFVGIIAGKFDRRWLLSCALILESAAAFAFTLVNEVGALSYGLRIAQGLAFVLMFNCSATLAADYVPRSRLGQAVGYMGLAMLTTNALAPLLTEPMAQAMGWAFTFRVSGIVAASALFIVALLDRDTKISSTDSERPRFVPGLGSVYYGSLLVGAGLGTLFTYVQPFALSCGATQVGDFFLGYVAAAFVARAGFGSAPDRLGAVLVASVAMALYALTTLAAAWVTPSTLIPLGAALGVSHGFIYPALKARGLTLVPASSRSVFVGWFMCAFNAGFAVAVLILGPLADKFGFPPIFIGTGVWIATGVLPLYFDRRAMDDSSAATPCAKPGSV